VNADAGHIINSKRITVEEGTQAEYPSTQKAQMVMRLQRDSVLIDLF
jgi:hypothetical protein